MDTKLTAALACAAALALGACSGGNPPATAAPETEMAGSETPETETVETETPETTDPPQDGMTEAERFDIRLAEAEADLSAARNRVTDAAAAAAVTGDGRTAALADIAAARKALTDALAAARELQVPPDDSGRAALAARLALKADAAEAEDLPRLRAAESSAGAGWAASSLIIERLLGTPEVAAVRKRRKNADNSDAETLLTAEKVPAVTYEEGKMVMAPGLRSSGDRLRMRGIPVIRGGGTGQPSDARQFLYFGHFFPPFPYLDPAGGGNNGVVPRLVAGLTITPSGLVVDMGGRGAPGLDLRPDSLARVQPSGSNGGYDLTLNFGRPADSPEGNAEHYWTAALMPTTEHLRLHSSTFRDGERIVPLGTYTMRLSNHIGLDRNLEYPDDSAAYALDDTNYYLSYAAYGHMEFVGSVPGYGVTESRRSFPFHVGYDAFKGEAGMSSTDIADADKITKGKFKGRTLAAQLPVSPTGGSHLALTAANHLRLRGDVELTATISGTAADNRISGKITNLESFSNSKGIWEDYAGISGALTLQATDIDAKGEFRGVVDTASESLFSEGGYRGNFYGPLAVLEAAGIWYLQDGTQANDADNNLSIVGSFGAALVRDDGTYGVVVDSSGN